MRNLDIDIMEAKAMDFQAATAIAFRYSMVYVYAPEQRKDAQAIQRTASQAARRYLWAAIDRRKEMRSVHQS